MTLGRTAYFNQILVLLLLLSVNSSAQRDTVTYQWPYSPMTTQPTIGGTFGEYRSTSAAGHYHNGTDMSGPAGKPVLAVLSGVVAVAYDDGSTGYDSYVRVTSTINGQTKNMTYYHTRPTVSVGQSVSVGQQISTVAIDHVHLIEYRSGTSSLTGNQINSLRPEGGVSIYNDPWKPHIRFVRFHLDNSDRQLPANSLGSKVDIITHVEEVNGTSSAALNNGTYKIGYKILSADTQTVIYSPPDNGLRYEYYNIPDNSYVNVNYYQPESSTSRHVYIVTNGTGASNVASTRVVQNNYWDVDSFPYGDYVVMVFTEDTRGNADTVYVPVTTTEIDLIPPETPELKYIVQSAVDSFSIAWNTPQDDDLNGYRLYYSLTGSSYQLRDNENVLTSIFDYYNYYYTNTAALYLKLTAVDNAPVPNESDQSDVYGIRMLNDGKKILIVDGFNRYGGSGSWKLPYHDFVRYHGEAFNLSFESCSNESIISGEIKLNDYEMVIWILGDESTADKTFDGTERVKAAEFLEGGGKLFVSGSEIAWDLEGASSATAQQTQFLRDYLKAKFVQDNANIYGVYGEDGTAFEGLGFGYGVVSQGSPYPEDYPDVIDTAGGSIPVLKYNRIVTAGIAYTGTFGNSDKTSQLVYFGFPFETIWPKNARINVMTSILNYFNMLEPVSVEFEDTQVDKFHLSQNYPNPFNPSTIINYQIPFVETRSERSFGHASFQQHVTLKVYDLLGREVERLVDEVKEPGSYKVEWKPGSLSSGIYFYHLRAGEFQQTKKMQFIK
jgi:hypothetical protein